MKTIIDIKPEYIVYHHTGITRFTGCQCIKDCSCNEDFKPAKYDYYTVSKRINKIKTTTHSNLEEVNNRIKLILTLPINRIL